MFEKYREAGYVEREGDEKEIDEMIAKIIADTDCDGDGKMNLDELIKFQMK